MSRKKSAKSRGGGPKPVRKSYGTPRRAATSTVSNTSQSASSSRFTLQDEARMTDGRQSFWAIDTKLRNRGVQFVSAGLHSTMDEVPEEHVESALEEETIGHEERLSPLLNPSDPTDELSVISPPLDDNDAELSDDVTIELSQASTSIHPTAMPEDASSRPQTGASDFFIVDTTGDSKHYPKVNTPHIRSASPTNSDSSDEVLFSGRTSRPQVIEDPVTNIAGPPEHRSQDIQPTANGTSWDDTAVEWVHRSKPGVGWTIPRASRQTSKQPPALTFLIPKERASSREDALAVEDYLENIRQHEPGLLRAAAFAQGELDVELADGGHVHHQFEALSVSDSTVRAQQKAVDDTTKTISSGDSSLPGSDSEAPSDEDASQSAADQIAGFQISSDDEYGTDDEGDEEFDEAVFDHIDDETLASLLSKQEELGMFSNELELFDSRVDANVAKAAKRYAKETPTKSRRSKGTFPSASLMADVLDADPYNGFDIMDFERPSLRKRSGKGKTTAPELSFDMSDDELQEKLQSAWATDRNRKKARKQEREELRMQGLLGGKGTESKYGEGMTIWQIGKEFESFLGSDEQEKSLPPMDKRRRAMVHQIATEFNLKTKSTGKGNSRYTKLIKTKSTTNYVENRFVAKARKINLGFFPRADAPRKSNRGLQSATRGGISSAVRYRDGDIVGGAAPQIGVDNKGRAMLEKMGWSSGMALGAIDNKGILEPIAHVVKNSKSGLG